MSTVSEKIKNRPSACLDGTISVYEKAIPANTIVIVLMKDK